MTIRKQLHIGMSLAPTWLNGDAWRQPNSNIERLYCRDFYLDIARRAEAAKLDFLFRPDSLFLNEQALAAGPGFSSLDPALLLAAIAGETSHIGLITTASTTFYQPYAVARQIQSLNWLSEGRAGWNVVTALDGNENFGLAAMPSARERYERAEEFVDVVRKLWSSYPNSAVHANRDSGLYADPTRLHPFAHKGASFAVKGPLNIPSQSETPIPLVQAGASPEGRDFAASIADAVFVSAPSRLASIEVRQDLRRRAASIARNPDDILVLPGLSLYLAPTRDAALEMFHATHARSDRARLLSAIHAMTGLDLTNWPEDQRITAADLPGPLDTVRSQTHSALLRRLIERNSPALSELLASPEVIGSAHWRIIGTVDDAAREIEAWAQAGAIDGFIAFPAGGVDAVHLTLSELIPRLAADGYFRQRYSSTTLAGHFRD